MREGLLVVTGKGTDLRKYEGGGELNKQTKFSDSLSTRVFTTEASLYLSTKKLKSSCPPTDLPSFARFTTVFVAMGKYWRSPRGLRTEREKKKEAMA